MKRIIVELLQSSKSRQILYPRIKPPLHYGCIRGYQCITPSGYLATSTLKNPNPTPKESNNDNPIQTKCSLGLQHTNMIRTPKWVQQIFSEIPKKSLCQLNHSS